MTKIKAQREYKDRLFKLIFREKKDLLELYNAINQTDYQNPEEIQINTLEDVVYLGMKNDLSFLLRNELNLYEHQSTYSPNLPLRGLFYFADLYRGIVGTSKDIYSSKAIELPMPRFIVFYNGTKEEPERKELALSELFQKTESRQKPCLECTVTLLNINLGKNQKLMEKCRRLYEYAQLIAKIRAKLANKLSIADAVDQAVLECIEEGILADILRKHREEVVDMLLTEYDEEFHIQCEREIAMEEGEDFFAALAEKLIRDSRMEDLRRAVSDKQYRGQLFLEYGIK